MSKVSRGRRSAKTSAFRLVDERHPRPEVPLDDAIEQRVDHRAIGRRIRRLERRIARALGEHKGLFWQLDDLRAARERALNEAFFEVGYGHGLAAGRADVLRRSLPQASSAAHRLADETRTLVVSAGLRTNDAAAALLETAWTIMLGDATPANDRG